MEGLAYGHMRGPITRLKAKAPPSVWHATWQQTRMACFWGFQVVSMDGGQAGEGCVWRGGGWVGGERVEAGLEILGTCDHGLNWKAAPFDFGRALVPGRLAGHKAGCGPRIMAADGRGVRQLANSAPICFHETGEEISEDAMPERHARRQKGRLKIKWANILPVSPHDAHFSATSRGEGIWPFTFTEAGCGGRLRQSLQLIRRSHVSPPEARSEHTDVAWSVMSDFPLSSFSLFSPHARPVFPS